MEAGQASTTAEYMALFRALESVRPLGRRLVEDPFAVGFLRPWLRTVVALSRVPPIGRLIRGLIDRRWPGARTSAVARTCFIDDIVRARLGTGIDQVVILGAGFDARPYRIPAMSKVVVFEVDHPATSAAKRAAIKVALGASPAHVRFVSINFNADSLGTAMQSAGYDPSRPTLFIWEGVTNYLTEAVVTETLRWCATATRGSHVLFTYIHRRVLEAPDTFDGTEKLFATLKTSSERWTFGLDPAQLSAFLVERGLLLDDDRGATEYRAQYYGPEANPMRGYEFYRIALAHVA